MAIMEEESVKLISEGEIAEILINRPQNLNALNTDVLQGLILLFDKVLRNPSLRVIAITGAGDKSFVAGADIASMAELGPRAISDYVELGQRAMRTIECSRVPVIAAVNGYALGGGLELAMACDVIVASQRAKLGQPEVNLGIIPGFGGTQRLVQRCGIGAARRLIYTGDIISADEAYTLGIVDKVVPPESLKEEVKKMALTICAKAPLAVERAKTVIRSAHEQTLLSGLRFEVEAFLHLFQTRDREEGMAAFLEKREAKFVGK